MKKVLFLGDSLSLPRADRSIRDDDTWCVIVYKHLARKYWFYYHHSGGAESEMLLWCRQHSYLAGYDPDIVVLQVGIVDCAPRCFTRAEMLAFKALGLRGFMRGWAHRHHATLTKLRRMSWIKPASFQTSLTELRDSFGGAEWLVIPIAPANSSYIRHSPRIAEQISAYNDILQHVFAEGFVGEAFEGCDVEGLFADDMHHLLPHGHRHLARVIVRRLEALDDA